MPPQEGEADLFKRENYKPTPKNHGPSLVSLIRGLDFIDIPLLSSIGRGDEPINLLPRDFTSMFISIMPSRADSSIMDPYGPDVVREAIKSY